MGEHGGRACDAYHAATSCGRPRRPPVCPLAINLAVSEDDEGTKPQVSPRGACDEPRLRRSTGRVVSLAERRWSFRERQLTDLRTSVRASGRQTSLSESHRGRRGTLSGEASDRVLRNRRRYVLPAAPLGIRVRDAFFNCSNISHQYLIWGSWTEHMPDVGSPTLFLSK
jgi:hypothetical protein